MMQLPASVRVDPAATRQEQARRYSGPAFAALDLGTNNCRMLVGAPSGDGFRVIDSFSRIVRLGEGLHHTGQLADAAMDRAIDALRAGQTRLVRRDIV